MNEIARAAGVGAATLYRHFPSRNDLADAVYEAKLDELTARTQADAVGQDGLAALREWLMAYASFMLATRSMMDTLRAAWTSPAAASSPIAAKIAGIVGGLLDAGRRDGTIRADCDAADVTVAVLALLSATPPGGAGDRTTRLLQLLADGLSAEARRHPAASSISSPSRDVKSTA